MRNIFIACLVFLPLLCLGGCSKDDNSPTAPVDLLPPATQIGANTVGCLVNGEVFLPKGGGLSGNKNCFYQFVDGGYHFALKFSNSKGNDLKAINILTNKAEIAEGNTYVLNRVLLSDISGRGGGIPTEILMKVLKVFIILLQK